MTDTTDAAARRSEFVRALQEEREGYLRRGLTKRVAEVDAQLVAHGVKPSAEQVTRAAKKPTKRA